MTEYTKEGLVPSYITVKKDPRGLFGVKASLALWHSYAHPDNHVFMFLRRNSTLAEMMKRELFKYKEDLLMRCARGAKPSNDFYGLTIPIADYTAQFHCEYDIRRMGYRLAITVDTGQHHRMYIESFLSAKEIENYGPSKL